MSRAQVKAYNPFLAQTTYLGRRSPYLSTSLSIEEFSKQSAEICSKMHNTTQYQQPSLLRTPDSRAVEDPVTTDAADTMKTGDAYFELLNLQHSLQAMQNRRVEVPQDEASSLKRIYYSVRYLQQRIQSETMDAQLLQLSERLRQAEARLESLKCTGSERRGPTSTDSCEGCPVVREQKLALIALQEQNDLLSRTLDLMRLEKAEMQTQLRKLLVQNDELVGIVQALRRGAE